MKRIFCLICAAVLLLPCLALGESAEEITGTELSDPDGVPAGRH